MAFVSGKRNGASWKFWLAASYCTAPCCFRASKISVLLYQRTSEGGQNDPSDSQEFGAYLPVRCLDLPSLV